MNNGSLSQDEINALLKGDEETSPGTTEEVAGETPGDLANAHDVDKKEGLSSLEKDAVGEIGNIGMGSAATALSMLLGKRVAITTPKIIETTKDQLGNDFRIPCVVVKVQYTDGLEGFNLLVINTRDASIIADLMMGGDGTQPSDEINEIQLSAVSEAMNQMMGSTTTSLSTMLDKRIDISPPILDVVELAEERFKSTFNENFDDLVRISFRMEIENLVDSEIVQLIPVIYAREMVNTMLGGIEQGAGAPPVTPESTQPPMNVGKIDPAPVSPPIAAAGMTAAPAMSSGSGFMAPPPTMSQQPANAGGFIQSAQQPAVSVQPAQFAPLNPVAQSHEVGNIGLIMDVPLEISVELGRTRKTIKDILELGTGSIIQLDRLAGEPVDLLVNGKLVAKGEVVVIDESFGIRVTSIVSTAERLNNLQ